MKLLLLTLLLFTSLLADKVLYLSHTKIPERVIKGEVFSITIKTLSTIESYHDIEYSFSTQSGVKVLNPIPTREKSGKYFHDTFKLIATSKYAKLPNITATLVADEAYEDTILAGRKLNIITLNPKKDYSNIIANSLQLIDYKTTSYDSKHNIIVFTMRAENSDIQKINFNDVYKQGIESIEKSYENPKVTYFVVVKKELENFTFTYFNLIYNSFSNIKIPIVVDDDSVTTQTDLKPKDQSKEKLKVQIASGIALLIFILAIWRRKYIYLILILFPIVYIVYFAVPSEDVCISKGSDIRLLPVNNGTIFETTSQRFFLPKEGKIKGYTKVKLKNEKIGWVKNEDLCSP